MKPIFVLPKFNLFTYSQDQISYGTIFFKDFFKFSEVFEVKLNTFSNI